MSRHVPAVAILTVAALLIGAGAAGAASPEEACQKGRYAAAAKYNACQQKALAKYFGGAPFASYAATSRKCRAKYAAVWPRLRAKTPSSSCDVDRFTDDGATVTDNLTRLQWEKKTVDASVHDVSNTYSWSATSPFTAADGTAFTTLLAAVNGGGCLAGQCNWRLPTILELQTILDPTEGDCGGGSGPCIDPIFGPTAIFYWTDTAYVLGPGNVWIVVFNIADVNLFDTETNDASARAVRGGL